MPPLYSKKTGYVSARFLSLLIYLVFATPPAAVIGQLINKPAYQCATANLSPALRSVLEAEAVQALRLKKASGAAFTAITYVPIRPHILRKTDGTGGYTMASLNNVMALTNKYYLQNGNGIQFYFSGTTPDYINNDAQYNSFSDETAVAQGRDATNAMNQYYVNSFASGAGGYAYYPANVLYSTRSFILNESGDEDDMGNRLIPHELGHNFNLVHTFGQVPGNGSLGSGTTLELVTRGTGANCTTEGDYLCDTPADPYNISGANLAFVNGCPQYDPASTARDANGLPYTPSVTNIMSYYFPCTHDFTAGQYDRMQAGLALRQSHTAYTLNAPETIMTAPSNLVASILNGGIVITWQDNASNEMGYFIERSTSPTTGFMPIGGVAPNITTFTDRSFASRTTYYYRIKGSNTTSGSNSSTVSILTPDCFLTFLNDGCSYAINITGVTVNNTTLSQNSGCSPTSSGYYTSFTAVSGTVTAGQSATFTATKGTFNNMGGTVWIDLNNNGVFETSERLYQMPDINKASTFSGSLAIPSSITATTVAMRVVAAYLTVPADPCGSYGYGETEDYVLIVRPACVAPIASLSGTTTTLTAGQVTTLTASLTGAAPFSLTVNASSGSPLSFTGIAASPFSFTVAPVVSTTYTLGRVSIGCSSGTVSGTAIVTVNPCTAMYTLKEGDWNDPTVWSCNHIPTQTELVQIGHTITIPSSYLARALNVGYTDGGKVVINSTAALRLGP
ncbi:GEVED domain-containing protein [Spirosoma pollinicola]|uniref:Fibronectin type-III domain-containing protein n=1 Tax=Spirosoma pollinicola TaxID=2057025 RepID=A0A2K8Z4L9_9BACT|nr:GEVED domain-containing protein [Spirosoma pollinicola]AUD04815.1 hypothetical protein CWM47_25030 [Spirosoma pollinicola]